MSKNDINKPTLVFKGEKRKYCSIKFIVDQLGNLVQVKIVFVGQSDKMRSANGIKNSLFGCISIIRLYNPKR